MTAEQASDATLHGTSTLIYKPLSTQIKESGVPNSQDRSDNWVPYHAAMEPIRRQIAATQAGAVLAGFGVMTTSGELPISDNPSGSPWWIVHKVFGAGWNWVGAHWHEAVAWIIQSGSDHHS